MSYFKKKIIYSAVLVNFMFTGAFYIRPTLVHAQAKETFPRVANIYLKTPLSNADADNLAKWDVVILQMIAQQNSSVQIQRIRQKNPDIIILAYIASEEFPISYYRQWDPNPNTGLFYQLLSGISDDMWLKDSGGNHVTFWKDNWMLNVTNYTSTRARWNDYLSSFVANKILSTGLWDGVFYDNVWNGVSWIHDGDIDANKDGNKDGKTQLDSSWEQGMKTLFNLTKQKAGNNTIIIGNGEHGFYGDINGLYMENFTQNTDLWTEKMRLYKLNVGIENPEPHIAIIGNTNLNSLNNANYKNMRFGLTSSLLENGYYAYDAGSNYHSEQWWYDEYNVNLGLPIGTPASKNKYTSYSQDVWQRTFQNGIAITNSTGQTQTVSLGGEYEKIHGSQDPRTNDGSIVSEVTVPGNDGVILLKTFESMKNMLFTNGAFVRFFRPDGSRARNGFFVFEESYKGGDQVLYQDLDGNELPETLVAHANRLSVWRDDGQLYMRIYPYTVAYQGQLVVTVGDLNDDGKKEVYVAPSKGYALPVLMLTRDGRQMRVGRYPFGEKYTGGYHLAIATTPGWRGERLIIGSGDGTKPTVSLYDYDWEKKGQWSAFEQWFTGGVYVAAGDLDGDGLDEIIAGKGPGGKPVIHVFDYTGKSLYPEFTAYTTIGNPGIDVRAVDVDFDGKDEIVGLSNDAF